MLSEEQKIINQIEQRLLGSILRTPSLIDHVSDSLRGEYFMVGLHGRIFNAMLQKNDVVGSFDVMFICDLLKSDSDLKSVGDHEYFAALVDGIITSDSGLLMELAKNISENYARRALADIGKELDSRSNDSATDFKTLMDNAFDRMDTVYSEFLGDKDYQYRSIGQCWKAAEDKCRSMQGTNMSGLSTGFTGLDKYIDGIREGQLIVLAARPSMGKTALAFNIACNVADMMKRGHDNGAAVAFFSLEMPSDDLMFRKMSSDTQISSKEIRTGNLSDREWEEIRQSGLAQKDVPLYICDASSLTVGAIKSRVRKMRRELGIGLVVIDYLGLIACESGKQSGNTTQEVTAKIAGLKSLARGMKLPVIVLSQLSRGVESRENKRPLLADLRDSGAIEQDADVVMFVYREEYYLIHNEPSKDSVKNNVNAYDVWQENLDRAQGKAEIIIAKNRNGETGAVEMTFDKVFTQFKDIAS